MKCRIVHIVFSLLAAGLLAVPMGCQKSMTELEAEPDATVIGINPSTAGMSKALTEWSNANLTDAQLRIDAYLAGTATNFLDCACYKYITVFSGWRFYDPAGDRILHHYWPIAGSVWNSIPMDGHLDFVGYLPYSATAAVANTGVTIGSYTAGNPNFTVSMPGFASRDSQIEFLYALSADQTKDSGGGTVNMTFHHPFASVYFALDVAPRGTVINSITLENIYRDGSFNHTGSPQWSSPSNLGTYAVTGIDKRVPDQLNYGQTIDGPFFVMPQLLNHQTAAVYDVKITVDWTDKDSVPHTASGVIGSASAQWLPGYAYSYSLKIGDRSDDGIVDVTVIAWSIEGSSTIDID